MPAPSKASREAWAIAEHHPEKLFARNRGMLSATHEQMHDFASTPERGLPTHVGKSMRSAMRRKKPNQ